MSHHTPFKVWIVEDIPLMRGALVRALAGTPDFALVGDSEGAEALLDDHEADPDLVVMDLGLPGMSGIDAIRELRRRRPETRVLVLTVRDDDEAVFGALCAGASGYLLKDTPAAEVPERLRQVARGAAPISPAVAARVLDLFVKPAAGGRRDPVLTEREGEVLELVAEGLTTQAVAGRLEISYHTVDTHLRSIYDKLHVSSRAAAVATAIRDGLLGRR